jgi:polyvinyl alcohol dehydrogenase (cytochrome)
MLKLLSLLLFMGSVRLPGQDVSSAGSKIYGERCASCHESGALRMPTRSQLHQLASTAILRALNAGVMKEQSADIPPVDRATVAQWLGRKTGVVADTNRLKNACRSDGAGGVRETHGAWTSWGGNITNLRYQPATAAGLTAADARRLMLRWAFAVPDETSLRSQPAVYDGRVIFGGGGMLYSLDASTGCAYWATEMPAAVRSGITVGSPGGRTMIFFGDQAGNVQAVDATGGEPIWQTHTDDHPAATVTGTPVYWNERLYVPVASYEEVAAAAPGYVCCTFRGSVMALDARTGEVLWKTFSVEEPDSSTRWNNRGAKSTGPSGVGVWSAPTIDVEKELLYATTGDNYSDPPTDKSDGVMALSLATGTIVWWKQLRGGDAFNNACMDDENKNCPDASGPDFDFGSSAILIRLLNGRRAMILTQKSGAVYAVDPDKQGEVIWQAQIGKGGVLGGIQWGAAVDSERLYAALSDEAFLDSGKENDLDPNAGGGMFALKLENGGRAWEAPAIPCDAHRPCSPAQQAAVTVIPGVVFSGSLDGHLRAYATEDGQILWDYDTIRDYATVNGVAGRGGSLNVAGPVIVDGTVFAISGYDQVGGTPGNVLLTFSPEGR